MKTSGKFPKFRSWGEGYYAFSIGISEAENVKNYIMNQEAHHARNNFLDEMRYLAEKYSVAWYPADWEGYLAEDGTCGPSGTDWLAFGFPRMASTRG